MGYVDDPIPFLQKATVFIAPILSGSGTRLKLLEAMAAGEAIVTTKIGCEGIIGINNIHLLIADTPEQFAGSVVRTVRDYDLRNRLGNNARKMIIPNYDWKVIIDKLDSLYNRIVLKK